MSDPRRAKTMGMPTHRWASGIILAAILVVGISPYLFLLPVWPHSWDATVWIARGAPTHPDWTEWVFGTRQFNVGYRPVTGISYTLDNWVGGFAAAPYRLTDFLLHLACAALIYLLYRRIAPHLPSWGGLVASGLFLAHPVSAQIVPHLARRSYSLATVLSLAAIYLLCPSGGEGSSGGARGGWGRSLAGGALLALALLANESSILALAVLPALALRREEGHERASRRFARICVVPWLFVGMALLLRWAALPGDAGGYTVEFDRVARFVPIVSAAWKTLGAATGLTPATTLAALLLLVPASVYYLWRAFGPLILGARSGPDWLLALLASWVGAYLIFFGLFGVWFPRQAYVVLPPAALLLGVMLADTFRLHGEHRPALVSHLVPQVLVLGWIVLQSPIIHGVDPMRAEAWRKTDQVLREMYGAIVALPEPASVWFAAPHFKRKPTAGALRAKVSFDRPNLPARQIETWMGALFSGKRLQLAGLLTYERHPQRRAASPRLVREEPPFIELPAGTAYVAKPDARLLPQADGSVRIELRPAGVVSEWPEYLFFHDGNRGTTIRLDVEQMAP